MHAEEKIAPNMNSSKRGGKTNKQATTQATTQATMQATMQVTPQVKKLLEVFVGEMNRAEIQKSLNLNNREYVRLNYIQPALAQGVIELVYPDNPKHPRQKYRLAANAGKNVTS
jgi:ribulose bisphosphate carboxylase small subunit